MRSLPKKVFVSRPIALAQAGGATGAGQHAGRGDLVSAGGTIEPVFAIFALGLRKALLFFAFGTLAIHLPAGDIIGEQQTAPGTLGGVSLADLGAAGLHGTDENGLAGTAPVLPFFQFLAHRAFFHNHHLIIIGFYAQSSRTSPGAADPDSNQKPDPGARLLSVRGRVFSPFF
jgi:hypothetical protein